MVADFVRQKLELPPSQIRIDEFPSGAEVSTWIIPKKYTLRDYSLHEVLNGKERAVVTRDLPVLSIAEYSRAVDARLSWTELFRMYRESSLESCWAKRHLKMLWAISRSFRPVTLPGPKTGRLPVQKLTRKHILRIFPSRVR